MYTHGTTGSRRDGAAGGSQSSQQVGGGAARRLDSNTVLPTSTELKTPEKSTELKWKYMAIIISNMYSLEQVLLGRYIIYIIYGLLYGILYNANL